MYLSLKSILLFTLLLTTLLTASCASCDGPTKTDSGSDAGFVTSADSGTKKGDAGTDAGIKIDAGVDAGSPIDEILHNLTVIYKTKNDLNAGTTVAPTVCFSENDCFKVETPGVRDYSLTKNGEVAVFQIKNINLNKSDLKFVQFKGNFNAWKPSCVALHFDGEPKYCNNQIDVSIKTAGWKDPDGFTKNCMTCEESVIPQGPIQGANGKNHLQFWMRSDAARPFRIRLAKNENLSDGTIVFEATPDVDQDYINKIKLENLEENTQYYYRAEVQLSGAESELSGQEWLNMPTYPIKTLPSQNSTENLKIAVGSCANKKEQKIYRSMYQRAPDLFLFIGDTHYANSYHKEAHSWYLNKARREVNVKKLLAHTPTLTIWDDHDFLGNNTSGMCEGIGEATKSFKRQWSNPDLGLDKGTYFSYSYGKLDFFMLDCRSFRPSIGDITQVCRIDNNAETLLKVDGMLGRTQEDWLINALKNSSATFKFLACGSQWRRDGTSDSWKSFPVALNRLMQRITEESVKGLVLLDGDVHRSEFNMFEREGDYSIPIITSSNLAYDLDIGSSCLAGQSETRTACFKDHNFVLLDVNLSSTVPEFEAQMIDIDNVIQKRWTIKRSELE